MAANRTCGPTAVRAGFDPLPTSISKKPYVHFYYESAFAAAEKRGVRVEMTPVTEPAEIERAFANIGSDGGMIAASLFFP